MKLKLSLIMFSALIFLLFNINNAFAVSLVTKTVTDYNSTLSTAQTTSTMSIILSKTFYCPLNTLTIYKQYYTACYNSKINGTVEVFYKLEGNKVNKKNIKKRPSFYSEKSLLYLGVQKSKLHKSADYKHSGYDRGHIASDASFDYSKDSLYSVYSMINITPQKPKVNRKIWRSFETQERKLAVKYKKIVVINKIYYSPYISKIKYLHDRVPIPEKFCKLIYVYGIPELFNLPQNKIWKDKFYLFKKYCVINK